MSATQMRSQRPGSKAPPQSSPSASTTSTSRLRGPPPTQNTAPVLEFACLYTHDVRRRGAKRWHDGCLRFHTFNRRAMLYDLPARNFLGDAHCPAGEPADGDDMTFERVGVLVQVAELVGRSETDLSEVTRKKTKTQQSGVAPAVAGRAISGGGAGALAPAAQARHRSLTSLLGTPRGPIGKAALPVKSPFELRRGGIENAGWEDGRPPKRLRMQMSPSKAQTPLNQTRKNLPTSDPRIRNPETSNLVDLSSDVDDDDSQWPGLSSDLLEPASSLQRRSPAVQTPLRSKRPASVRSSSPGFRTMDTPAQARMARRKPGAAESQCHNDRSGGSSRNLARGHDVRSDAVARANNVAPRHLVEEIDHEDNTDTSAIPAGPTLRLASAAPKKKLLMCQDQLLSRPSRLQPVPKVRVATSPAGVAMQTRAEATPAKSERKQLEERLARLNKNRGTDVRSVPHNDLADPAGKSADAARQRQPSPRRSTSRLGAVIDDTAAISDEMAEWFSMSQPLISPGPPPAANGVRQLRRVVSEAGREPLPKKSPCRSRLAAGVTRALPRDQAPPKAPVSFAPQRPFRKPQPPRLDHSAGSGSAKAADPWSREAFDLFTWRPPGWDEEKWCAGDGTLTV